MRRLTVRELTAELTRLLAARYPAIEVEGEVSQVSVPGSGHAYLSLRDDDATLGAVCWRDTWRNLDYRPERGDRVVCRGRMGVYGGKGAYQLYVHHIARAGEGSLAAEIARRRARLEADGLLDPRRKRPLPRFPRIVGVATSLTGAALQDFLKVSRERFPATRILVAGCQVQGATAPASIVQALDRLLTDGRCDVLVVTRGGGSKEDLLAFQDEGLARFIAASPVPVVSAVGHQVDTTLSDLVADAVAPTPTAAAVTVLPDGPALAQRVDEASLGLERAMLRRVHHHRREVVALRARLRHPAERLQQVRSRTEELLARARAAIARRLPSIRSDAERARDRLQLAMLRGLERRAERLRRAEARLEALSPQAVLRRGFAVVVGPLGVVDRVERVSSGDVVSIRVADGSIRAIVEPGEG